MLWWSKDHFPVGFHTCGEYHLFHQHFITNFVIPFNPFCVFKGVVVICFVLPMSPNYVPVRFDGHIKQHVPSRNSCIWGVCKHFVISRANNPFMKKSTMSLLLTVLAMLMSVMWSIPMIPCGFWTVISLSLIPHVSHRDQNEVWTHSRCHRHFIGYMNGCKTRPFCLAYLLWLMFWQSRVVIHVCILCCPCNPLYTWENLDSWAWILTIQWSETNWLPVPIKSICVLSLLLRVYGPMRSTYNASIRVGDNELVEHLPYF